MHLISCDECGVVLDKNKLRFPPIWEDDDIVAETSEWDGDRYVATMPCPVCKHKIVDED